jgi:hypothetical protein
MWSAQLPAAPPLSWMFGIGLPDGTYDTPEFLNAHLYGQNIALFAFVLFSGKTVLHACSLCK